MNTRIIEITNSRQARQELAILNCDKTGINIMSAKAVFKTLKIEKVPSKAANLLKQTFLAKGGEVAVARGTADLSVDYTDVIVCATLKQFKMAITQLKLQPWGLPKVADQIEKVLGYSESFPFRKYTWNNKEMSIKPRHTLVMGILNITPDSFSDGGRFNSIALAIQRVNEMIEAGADIIDIGAESTRPYSGAKEVTAEEELDRLLPILEDILAVTNVPVSIDTYKPYVAEACLKLGAHIINDVWGLQRDPDMARIAAEHNVPIIVMHNQAGTSYKRDILSEIIRFLQKSIEIGLNAGISFENFIVDPGIGFGKTPADNLIVMSRLEELKTLGCPILLGSSRKRFIGEVLNLPVEERVEGTAATAAIGITKGVNIIRVHDVKEIKRIAKMTDAMMKEGLYER